MIKAASNAAYLTGGPTVGKLYNLNVIKLTGTPNPSYIICKYEKYSKHGIDSISILQLFVQYLFIPLLIRIYLQILLPNPTRSVMAKIGNLNSSILIFNEYS